MELIVKTEVEAMTIDYDIETDGLYLQGKVEGKIEGFEIKEHEFVHTLWLQQDFSIEKMAMLVKATPERILEVIISFLQTEGLSEAEAIKAIAIHEEKFNPPMKE